MTLEGSKNGIQYYLTANVTRLGDVNVWSDATIQVFYSLGVSFGNLITMSSYSKFKSNCHRDAILVSFINCGTSFFAGLVVFSILGVMARTEEKTIADVVSSGPQLAFVTYPKAVLDMPLSPLWSFLFFSMLFSLALSSMIPSVSNINAAVIDQLSLQQKQHYVTIGICTIMFLGGLSMCCNGGYYMFDLFDKVSASWNSLLIALIEVIIAAWLYGGNTIMKNIKQMEIWMPKFLEYYWKLCWFFITPVLLTTLLLMQFINAKPFAYDPPLDDEYPPGIQALAWLLPITPIVIIPAFSIHHIITSYRAGESLGWNMFRPTSNWGPPEYLLSTITETE